MDLRDRIARRRSARREGDVVVDRDELSPVSHRAEPVGRGPVLEALLDVLDPVFDDELPSSVAVVGPHGAGTSAVVTALFDALDEHVGGPRRTIGTSTRAGSDATATRFVYVDARRATSPFAFYRTVLAAVSRETVPESGVGTEDLRERLWRRLDRPGRRAIVAIDHHDEAETLGCDEARELLAPVSDGIAIVPVGRRPPDGWEGPTVEVAGYSRHDLVDVLTERTSAGLVAGALGHDAIDEVAAWADGNAHDALAATFGAATLAADEGATAVDDAHLERAMEAVPGGDVHLDRVLSLSATRQRVLRELLSIDATDRPIGEVAAAVADRSSLTEGTVKRLLYELADLGVVERVPLEGAGDAGRQPSAVRPLFPTLPFLTLTAAEDGN